MNGVRLVSDGIDPPGDGDEGAAERAVRVRSQPRVDTREVKRVVAFGQQPQALVLFELTQTDRAIRAVHVSISLLVLINRYRFYQSVVETISRHRRGVGGGYTSAGRFRGGEGLAAAVAVFGDESVVGDEDEGGGEDSDEGDEERGEGGGRGVFVVEEGRRRRRED